MILLNNPHSKKMYAFTSPFEKGGLRGIYLKNLPLCPLGTNPSFSKRGTERLPKN
ncbi:hypothetical protein CRENPOLYSF2_70011 [Crenothrix polyspora]|uniref:Uncharacterized protein n=1 Tax=Crenothrix polyspora TaxID=360316 RepID=A0A1R4HIN5_9GAMM|nr:hypothetical protein CRENPOLYSF2_70011 [Crenothrix polyspora]